MLKANTNQGPFGVRIPFADGLVVLRADNSSGKSTCIQAIIYALGLDAMFTQTKEVPLPRVMTDELHHGDDILPVLDSEVWLEIENSDGKIMTIKRAAAGESDNRLISTWDGPALSVPDGNFTQRDLYVRFEGAATRPDGFHYRLAQFLGWQLPTVPRIDGSSTLLYLECIFPLMIIEQKRGWSAIQARIPQVYRIRDVNRRAIEYLLALDVEGTALDRQRIENTLSSIKTRWKSLVQKCIMSARSINGTVQGLSSDPLSSWPPEVAPAILVPNEDVWLHLSEYVQQLSIRHEQLVVAELPSVAEVAADTSESLDRAIAETSKCESIERSLLSAVDAERATTEGLQQRLAALDEDIHRYKDVQRLRSLGSVVNRDIANEVCPTCHQPIEDTLLPPVPEQTPMSVDDNISFLEEQRKTFLAMLGNAEAVLHSREQQLADLRLRMDELRSSIRALKRTLVSDERLPSEALIEERVRLAQLERVSSEFSEYTASFSGLADQWAAAQEEKRGLPEDGMSDEDTEKLKTFEKSFKEQVLLYGITSVPPRGISISHDTYRPVYQRQYDLDFELSASDMIRMIWAYVVGLLEVQRDHNTNHPGLLILDEPRQQETKEISFGSLLARASTAELSNQQVIFATSEEPDDLQKLLAGLPHALLTFEGKLIQPLH